MASDRAFGVMAVAIPAVGGLSVLLAIATISDSTWIALISAGPPTIAALFAGLLGFLNHRQGSKIHVLVNSNMTAVKSELAAATARIDQLNATVRGLLNLQENTSVSMEEAQRLIDRAKPPTTG